MITLKWWSLIAILVRSGSISRSDVVALQQACEGVVMFGLSTFGTEGVEFGILAVTYNDSNRTKLQYRLERRDQSFLSSEFPAWLSTQHMPTESRGRLLRGA